MNTETEEVKRGRGRPKQEYVANDETTPVNEHRKRMSEKKKERVAVEEVWFEWVLRPTLDPKKGRKLVKKLKTKTGISTEFAGWEKQFSKEQIKKMVDNGDIRVKKEVW